jgi:hypothetical protein
MLNHFVQIVLLLIRFLFRVPILMTVIALLVSFSIALPCFLIFGLEVGTLIAFLLALASVSVFGIGIFTAIIVALTVYALRGKLTQNGAQVENQLIFFAGAVASTFALLVYPDIYAVTMLSLSDSQAFIGQLMYAIIVCFLAMIGTVSAIEGSVEKPIVRPPHLDMESTS